MIQPTSPRDQELKVRVSVLPSSQPVDRCAELYTRAGNLQGKWIKRADGSRGSLTSIQRNTHFKKETLFSPVRF